MTTQARRKTKVELSDLALANARTVAGLAYGNLSNVQFSKPEEAACAAAMLLLALCKKHEIHPGDAIRVADNMLNHPDGRSIHEMVALRGFIGLLM